MIAKILFKSMNFKGVRYNTNKVDKGKGELIAVRNFGALQALQHLKPQDYINYLKAKSHASSRTQYSQFHAVISCKAKSFTKDQLTLVAEEWMKHMGYGDQPYLMVLHSDTANNHIHLVSTRVGKNGEKINDSFERLKSNQIINKIIGLNEHLSARNEIDKALEYKYTTRAQFMMLLEAKGYSLSLQEDKIIIYKYGKNLANINLSDVDEKLTARNKDNDRIKQLKAIIFDYKKKYDSNIYPTKINLPGGRHFNLNVYSSVLTDILKEKFGIQIIFHQSKGFSPYGYSVIDHSTQSVFKGSEIVKMKQFIENEFEHLNIQETNSIEAATNLQQLNTHEKDELYLPSDGGSVTDHSSHFVDSLNFPEIDISDDVDDEAIHGMKRKRVKKVRTNSR